MNKEEFCNCAKRSAELFRENGRIRKAQEEAKLSGDTVHLQELLKEARDIPSVKSQSHTKLSSEEVEEETKYQGSKVSNARPFTHKSLVTSHQDVT